MILSDTTNERNDATDGGTDKTESEQSTDEWSRRTCLTSPQMIGCVGHV